MCDLSLRSRLAGLEREGGSYKSVQLPKFSILDDVTSTVSDSMNLDYGGLPTPNISNSYL